MRKRPTGEIVKYYASRPRYWGKVPWHYNCTASTKKLAEWKEDKLKSEGKKVRILSWKRGEHHIYVR